MKLLTRLAVLVAAAAAFAVPVSAPASAAPAPAAVNCWTEIETKKPVQTIIATAYKDCVNYDVAQGLSLTLEIHVCNEWDGACFWTPWKSGVGTVTYTCPGTFWAAFRSSRLKDKIVYCSYF